MLVADECRRVWLPAEPCRCSPFYAEVPGAVRQWEAAFRALRLFSGPALMTDGAVAERELAEQAALEFEQLAFDLDGDCADLSAPGVTVADLEPRGDPRASAAGSSLAEARGAGVSTTALPSALASAPPVEGSPEAAFLAAAAAFETCSSDDGLCGCLRPFADLLRAAEPLDVLPAGVDSLVGVGGDVASLRRRLASAAAAALATCRAGR